MVLVKERARRNYCRKSKIKKTKNDNEDLSDMPQLEGDEEKVKVEKVLKILTPNKLVTRLPILFKFKLETFHTNLKK